MEVKETNGNAKEEQETLDLNLSSYTVKELKQLQEMTKTTLDHYLKIQSDTHYFASLSEFDKMAFELCLKQSQEDMELIQTELKLRSKT